MTTTVPGAQSFARSIDLLQLIADADTAPTRAQLLEHSGLTRPTLYRVLAALQAQGLIDADADNRYRPGIRLVHLARQALARSDVRKIAEPFLARLRDATGETVHLAIRSRDELVYIDKIESLERVRMTSTIGTRVAFHSSSVGKAYLSAMPAQDAATLIDRIALPAMTKFTTTSRSKLRKTVRAASKAGYIRDSQENEMGIVCFGAAILDNSATPVAAVSVSVPMFRLRKDTDCYSEPLRQTVADISAQLGYPGAG